MKKVAIAFVLLMVLLFALAWSFLRIPSPAGPPRAVNLTVGKLVSSNNVSRTYSVIISNMSDAYVLYPAAGDLTHHPLLALEYQTNSDWRYSVDVDIGGIMLPMAPHNSLKYQVAVPRDASKFKTGIFRIGLTWRGRLGMFQLDAVKRAKKDWSPIYYVTSNALVVVGDEGI